MNEIKMISLTMDEFKQMTEAIQVADALAKAAKHHVHSQEMNRPPCDFCALIAAYEKARGIK